MRKFLPLIFVATCFVNACNMFSAGSFPYAEIYKYRINEDSLIGMIELLKTNDSSLVVPEGYRFEDGRRDSSDYWYHIYLYNKVRDEVMLTWVRESIDTAYTDFAFIAVKKKEEVGNWKYINKDFGRVENKARKKEFKTLILDRIHLPIGED